MTRTKLWVGVSLFAGLLAFGCGDGGEGGSGSDLDLDCEGVADSGEDESYLYGCWLSCEQEGSTQEPCDPEHLWGIAFAQDGELYECHRIDEPPYDVYQIEITEQLVGWSMVDGTVSTDWYADDTMADLEFTFRVIGAQEFQLEQATGDGAQYQEGDDNFPEPFESIGRMRRVACMEDLDL